MKKEEGYYIYCKEYRHYKTGKLMRASDYGRKSWKFLVRVRTNK